MCRVSPSQKSAAEDWGDASLIYSDMSSMQSRPLPPGGGRPGGRGGALGLRRLPAPDIPQDIIYVSLYFRLSLR